MTTGDLQMNLHVCRLWATSIITILKPQRKTLKIISLGLCTQFDFFTDGLFTFSQISVQSQLRFDLHVRNKCRKGMLIRISYFANLLIGLCVSLE